MALTRLKLKNDNFQLDLNPTEGTSIDAWKRLTAFKKLNDDDMSYLIRPVPISTKGVAQPRAGSEKTLYNWCTNNDVDYVTVQTEIRTQYNSLTALTEEEADVIVHVVEDNIAEEEINLTTDDKLTLNETAMACTVLAAQYPLGEMNCKPNIHILGPSTTNKSTDMAKFKSADLVNWIGRTTLNAGAPGRPNRETERPMGWYERSNGRCVMINEAGNFVNELHARKVLGELADLTTTGVLTISDPVEDFEVHSQVTVAIAMTYHMHAMIEKANLGIGPRYMILKTKNNRKGFKNSTFITSKTTKPRSWYVNLVRTAAKREIGEPTDDMIEYAHLITQKIMDMASVRVKDETYLDDAIGGGRLGDQLVYMALMRGVLYNRPATIDDVSYFISLVANVIPKQAKWLRLLKQFPSNRSLELTEYKEEMKLSGMRMLIQDPDDQHSIKIDPEWFDFLNMMKKYW